MSLIKTKNDLLNVKCGDIGEQKKEVDYMAHKLLLNYQQPLLYSPLEKELVGNIE